VAVFKETMRSFQDFILNSNLNINLDVVSTPQLSAEDRLAIYREAYYLRLLEVLGWDFPVFKKYLGDELFERLGRSYIDAYPSRSPSILKFGRYFGNFLKTQEEIKSHHLEFAQFEWILENVRTFAGASQLSIEQLSSIQPEHWGEIRFALNPSIKRFESFWDAPNLWKAVSTDLPAPLIKKAESSENWLLWGDKGEAWFVALDAKTQCFFEGINDGKSFGEVCESLCDVMPESEAGEFAGRYLNQWIMERLIIKFYVP
jgi:hypothetical protein